MSFADTLLTAAMVTGPDGTQATDDKYLAQVLIGLDKSSTALLKDANDTIAKRDMEAMKQRVTLDAQIRQLIGKIENTREDEREKIMEVAQADLGRQILRDRWRDALASGFGRFPRRIEHRSVGSRVRSGIRWGVNLRIRFNAAVENGRCDALRVRVTGVALTARRANRSRKKRRANHVAVRALVVSVNALQPGGGANASATWVVATRPLRHVDGRAAFTTRAILGVGAKVVVGGFDAYA